MLNFNLTLILVLQLAVVSRANTQKFSVFDSLEQLIHDDRLADSVRFKAINNYYENYSYEYPDAIIPLIDYHATLAKNKDNKVQLALSLEERAIARYLKGMPDSALYYIHQSLDIRYELGDSLRIIKSLNNIANIHLQKAEYVEAINYYYQCLAMLKKNPDVVTLGAITNNIGLIFFQLEKYDNAHEYFMKAIKIYGEDYKKDTYAQTWMHAGNTLFHKKQYEQALKYNNDAFVLLKSGKDKYVLSEVYRLYSQIYAEKGLIDSALININRSLDIKRNIGNEGDINHSEILHAKYLSSTDSNKALEEGEEILLRLKNAPGHENKVHLYELLYKLYKEKGDIEKSLAMHELFVAYTDSLESEKNKLDVMAAFIQNEHKSEIQQVISENSVIQSEIRQKGIISNILIFAASGLLLLLLTYYFSKKIRQNNAEQQRLMVELETLKAAQKDVSIDDLTNAGFSLNKEKIETHIGRSLNETDWNVLHILNDDPVISNADLASRAFLSVDGIGSSLKRMYQYFDIKDSRYKKILLIMEVIKISSTK